MLAAVIVPMLAVGTASLEVEHGFALATPLSIARTAPNGIETFRLVVSPEGDVVSCVATVAGRGLVSDEPNCRKLRKLKARPATDAKGTAVYSVVHFYVTWTIFGRTAPKRMLPVAPAADFALPLKRLPAGVSDNSRSLATVLTSAEGLVESCAITKTSGSEPLDTAVCRAVAAEGVTPIEDAAGKGVRGVQTLSVSFTVAP